MSAQQASDALIKWVAGILAKELSANRSSGSEGQEQSFEDALRSLGFEQPHDLARSILRTMWATCYGAEPGTERRISHALYMIMDGGPASGVPTPSCIAGHLPKG